MGSISPETSNAKLFVTIINSLYSLTIFTNSSIIGTEEFSVHVYGLKCDAGVFMSFKDITF